MTSPYGPPQQAPLNAPAGAVTPIGVQPGVSPGLVFAQIIIVTGGKGSGIFVYSPTPGAGNLIGSWAGSAGHDQYGNAYPQGLNVTIGAISGTSITASTIAASSITASSFSGTDFIISPTGMLFYSGTPAAGNLITAIAPVAGSDSFGNTYPAGVGIGNTGSLLVGSNIIMNQSGLFIYGAAALVTIQKSSGSGTIAIPTGVTAVKAECWGSGAGGGGVTGLGAGTTSIFGGGGGEYSQEPALAVTHAAGVAYSVGAAGSGGVGGVSGGVGGLGNNSTLAGTSVTVTAHGGGVGGTNFTYGGSGSTNTVHFQGGFGVGDNASGGGGGGSSAGPSSAGNATSANTTLPSNAGQAAVSGGGPGGNGAAGNGNGSVPASGPGGGGGGSCAINNTSTFTGGNGFAGLVQVTYTPATNALVMSFASSGGTDGFGNTFPAGIYIADAITLANISVPSATSGAATAYAVSGNLKYISGLTGDGSAYNTGRLTVISSGQTVTGTGVTNLTGLSAPVGIGSYRFHASVLFEGSAAAGTAIFSFASPPSTSTCTLPGTITNGGGPGTATVSFGSFAGGFNINALSQTVTSPTLSNTQNYILVFDGYITFSAAGTLQMACKCGTNGDNVIVSNGSFMELLPVA